MNQNNHYTSREIWQRFKDAVRSFLSSPVGRRGVGWFVLLVSFLFAINGLNVVNSYVGRDFISAIEHKNHALFVYEAWMYAGVFVLSTIVAVFYRFAEERLGILWRDWQTQQFLNAYLDKQVYYHLEHDGTLENPDQRIAEDIRSFTATTLSFVLMMLNGTFTAVAFSGVLWSISPQLFLVAVAYAAFGTDLTVILGRKLVGLNNLQLDKEANFRSELIHLRENAESVALLHREGRLTFRLFRRLEDLVANFRRITNVNRNLGFFTTGYNYFIQLVPMLVVAPLFLKGQVEFGVITQAAMAFAQLMGAFSLIVTQFQSISSYAAVIVRLGKMVEAIDQTEDIQHSPIKMFEAQGRIVYEELNLVREDGGILVEDLSLTIERGTRVLVTGASGHAKVALFKATAGLACEGEGTIYRPDPDRMMFLPERPYLPKGTLRDLLLRPALSSEVSDDAIMNVLRLLNVESVVAQAGGLNVERDWKTTFGIGEQATLAIAHVLLASPEFVFFDRMSRTMDSRRVDQVLKLFTQRNISYLVLGKPDDSIENFDAVLSLERDGSWNWQTMRK